MYVTISALHQSVCYCHRCAHVYYYCCHADATCHIMVCVDSRSMFCVCSQSDLQNAFISECTADNMYVYRSLSPVVN